jgi:hypothetical protein
LKMKKIAKEMDWTRDREVSKNCKIETDLL